MLPRELDGLKIDHVIETRHPSFATPDFVQRLRDANASVVYTDAEGWPNIGDVTGGIIYARLQRGDDTLPAAYPAAELDSWAKRARSWAEGGLPSDLPRIDVTAKPETTPRDVFIYFIHEGKLRAPAAAQALIDRL